MDTQWNYVEKRYEGVLQRKVKLHEEALKAITEIENEILFTPCEGRDIIRTEDEKEQEIFELNKRFVMSDEEYEQCKFDIRNKVRRGRHNITQGEVSMDSGGVLISELY